MSHPKINLKPNVVRIVVKIQQANI